MRGHASEIRPHQNTLGFFSFIQNWQSSCLSVRVGRAGLQMGTGRKSIAVVREVAEHGPFWRSGSSTWGPHRAIPTFHLKSCAIGPSLTGLLLPQRGDCYVCSGLLSSNKLTHSLQWHVGPLRVRVGPRKSFSWTPHFLHHDSLYPWGYTSSRATTPKGQGWAPCLTSLAW